MKEFSKSIGQRKMRLFMIGAALIMQVLGTLLVPALIAKLIDEGILMNRSDVILQLGVQMVVVALLTTIFSVIGCVLCANFGARLGCDYRQRLFAHSQRLSLRDFSGTSVASMITRCTSDITQLQQATVMFLQLIVPAPLIAIAAIIMTARISMSLVWVPVLSIVLVLTAGVIFFVRCELISGQIQQKMDQINQVVREFLSGIRVIRAFDRSAQQREKCDYHFSNYASSMIRLNRIFAGLNPLVWLVMGLSVAALVALGGIEVASHNIGIGAISATIEYTIMTLGYMVMAAFSVVSLPRVKACIMRIEEILEIQPESDGKQIFVYETDDLPILEFRSVSFAYPHAEEPILNHLNFSIYANQTVALIGSTGSGKSTILHLLLGLHDEYEGEIFWHGHDLRQISKKQLRNEIGYVLQKANLLSGTIEENLLMANPFADFALMKQSLEIAQTRNFVDVNQQGLQNHVNQGGTNFSGGQKQRLSIARALVKNVGFMVFDDCFSALDGATEQALRQALVDERKNCTMLLVAQRIQSVRHANCILVLQEGQLVGKGTHQDLMKTCLAYQEIAASQLTKEECTNE